MRGKLEAKRPDCLYSQHKIRDESWTRNCTNNKHDLKLTLFPFLFYLIYAVFTLFSYSVLNITISRIRFRKRSLVSEIDYLRKYMMKIEIKSQNVWWSNNQTFQIRRWIKWCHWGMDRHAPLEQMNGRSRTADGRQTGTWAGRDSCRCLDSWLRRRWRAEDLTCSFCLLYSRTISSLPEHPCLLVRGGGRGDRDARALTRTHVSKCTPIFSEARARDLLSWGLKTWWKYFRNNHFDYYS